MLFDGMALGALTLFGFGVMYKRMPKGVKVFICKHPLLTDVVCAVFFYQVFGLTLIAHVACATMTLGVMSLLHIERNKQDYQFIYDLIGRGKEQINKAVDQIRQMNTEYMATREKEPIVLTSVK